MDATLIASNLCPLLTPTSSSLKSKPHLPLHGRGFFGSRHSRRQFLHIKPSTSGSGPSASAVAKNGAVVANSSNNGVYTVGDFMTGKEDLHTVKPTTTVDEALEMLVEHRITGFPVIDDDWNLLQKSQLQCKSTEKQVATLVKARPLQVRVGVVSDYDLLALDSISGSGRSDASMFPEVDSTWKTFNEIQKLLIKTNGKVIGELMTPAPLVVRETTNLEDAARLLLDTKYRRLPVVDGTGKLVGIITRGNVVRAALAIKHEIEKSSKA